MRSLLVAIVVAFGLIGCTTTSEIDTLMTRTQQIAPASVVALDVSSEADADSREVAQRVRDQLFGKLVSRGVFSAVRPKGEPDAAFDMTVQVSNVAKVSVAARFMVGVFAGGDELTATVTLVDRESGKTVNKFQVKTEAAAHWLSSDYGIDSAVNQLTDKITERL